MTSEKIKKTRNADTRLGSVIADRDSSTAHLEKTLLALWTRHGIDRVYVDLSTPVGIMTARLAQERGLPYEIPDVAGNSRVEIEDLVAGAAAIIPLPDPLDVLLDSLCVFLVLGENSIVQDGQIDLRTEDSPTSAIFDALTQIGITETRDVSVTMINTVLSGVQETPDKEAVRKILVIDEVVENVER